MRAPLVLLVLCFACASPVTPPDEPSTVSQPVVAWRGLSSNHLAKQPLPRESAECAFPLLLAATLQEPTGVDLMSVQVPASGATFCLRLDATQLRRAHFAVGTAWEPGVTSSFQLSVADPAGGVLHTGADVSVNLTNTQTRANLEWDPGTVVRLIKVAVTPTDGKAHTTSVSMTLLDPLD